jgi:ribosomal protein S18 acetylase RimI-like enzyme
MRVLDGALPFARPTSVCAGGPSRRLRPSERMTGPRALDTSDPDPDCGGHHGDVEPPHGLVLRDQPTGAGPVCRRILDALPSWFGIPAAVSDYIAVADRSPTVVASFDDADVGLTTIVRHGDVAAEVYVMGVFPRLHRHGVGWAMLRHAERALAADGVEFLQVKTLSPRHPDEGYQRTRAFYLAYGFRPLEEFPTLWSPDQPALQMVKAVKS